LDANIVRQQAFLAKSTSPPSQPPSPPTKRIEPALRSAEQRQRDEHAALLRTVRKAKGER
jgi:hypothetical protein